MPSWPASTKSLAESVSRANQLARDIKRKTQNLRDRSANTAIERGEFLELQRQLQGAIDEWTLARSKPGIGQYVLNEYSSGEFASIAEVDASFSSMVNAAMTLRDWIFNNFPRDNASGAVLEVSVDQGGVETELTFSSSALTQFRTEADAFISTID